MRVPFRWMGRRISLLAVLALAAISAADETRVSIVMSRSIGPYLAALDGTQEALRSAGVNLPIDVHDMQGDPKAGLRIASELKRRKPQLIVTVGTEATQVISQQAPGIPIVFSMVVHPETLVEENKPLVGSSMDVRSDEQMRFLRALLPNAKRIGLICNPSVHPPSSIDRRREAARQFNFELAVELVDSAADVPGRLRTLLPTIDAFWLIPDETVLVPETVRYLLLETLRSRVPVLAPSWRFIEEGALMAVACDYQDVGRQAGELAASLLAGRSMNHGSVVEARKSVLYLNLRTAKTLGIGVPESLIAKADRVLQ